MRRYYSIFLSFSFSSFKIIDNVLAKRKKKRTVTRISSHDSFTVVTCFTIASILFLSLPLSHSFALSLSLSLSLSLASFNSFVGECTDFASRDPRLIACTNVSKNKRRNCTVNGCSVFPFFFHFFFFFVFPSFLRRGRRWRQWTIVTEQQDRKLISLVYCHIGVCFMF